MATPPPEDDHPEGRSMAEALRTGIGAADAAAEAAGKLARQAEIQEQARRKLAKERADGAREGAMRERQRAKAEYAAALEAARAEHELEIARRDGLQERKLAEQRIEIRGAAFWRGALVLGLPIAVSASLASALLTMWTMRQGSIQAGAATRQVLESVGPDLAAPTPLRVQDASEYWAESDEKHPRVEGEE
jgi:hypothetical protein